MSAKHRMSNADAAWLRMDSPTNLMIINAVLLFDEPLDRERVMRMLDERIVSRFPRFRRRVVESALEGPAWQDDPHFDLRSHVHRIALPAPGDDSALQELVGDLMSAAIDRTRPLWHAYLVDGYGEGCAVVMRMHHCIADGIALARVMMMLTDERADDDVVDHGRRRATPLDAVVRPAAAATHAAEATVRTLVHESIDTLLHPRHAAQLAAETAGDARTLVKLLAAPPDTATALRGELGVARRVAWTRGIPLETVKSIGHAEQATVNDVLMSALTGALRRHLDLHGGAPDEMHAMVPFNLRPLDQPLEADLGNRFGLILLALPTGLADPVERLRELSRRMRAIKESHEGQIAYGILSVIGLTPTAVESRLIDMFSGKATLVCTNVPGPRKAVSFGGVPVRDVLVWAPTSGSVGLGVSIFSYRGHVVTGVMAAESVLPDPGELTRAYEDEIAALRGAAIPA